jgi:6-phosphogluconolactonase/glucosamine-6-phosphate isomerase/deaminase
VTGADKAGVFAEVFEKRDSRYPATRIYPVDGSVEILTDTNAAGRV